MMARVRDFGVTPGLLPTGALNAITDVAGVRVGHVTRIEGEGKLIPGTGPIRTGVTAILPHGGSLYHEKVAAGVYAVNGFGKATGFEQIRTRGTLETPILLTNTLNVGRVADALVGYMIRQHPEIGITTGTVNPVVAECNDGFLNDLQGRHIGEAHVWAAIEGATTGAVAEGNVGGGTGTACFQFKGGIGTSSRLVMGGRYTVGALVQTNYGSRAELMFLGVPLGQHLLNDYLPQPGQGSIIMVLATDAPMDSRQLTRLAVRAGIGLARTGTTSHDGSGDFVIAFSTARPYAHQPDDAVEMAERFNDSHPALNEFFQAAVEATEEAILNALVAAETMTGRDGNTLYALPHDALRHWLSHYRRI
jgi:D-aminopeptidase